MPIGGKDAFLSKVTFRRESDWVSKTKQKLNDMKEMIERAEKLAKSINEAHWCTDGLSFEEVISRLILREFQEEREMAVDKACEWLEMNIEYWLYDDGFLDVPAMLKDFRKAMEEQQ